MVVTTKAIVLSSIKYSESDVIVTCYTEVAGVKSYLVRGVLKPKKKGLRSSMFQPLTQLELTAFHKDKGTLESIKEARVISPYSTVHTNIVKTTLVMFLSEVLKNAIKEETPDAALYVFLTQSMDWLDMNNSVANFHISFLLQLSEYLGFAPDLSTIEAPYFNLIEGNFQTTMTGKYCEEGKKVEALKQFFGIHFDDLSKIKLTKHERLETLTLLLTYYQLHLQSFQEPKSFSILNQLFK